MPTYQYRCKECGHDFDIVQAFTDDALTKCPECKKKALKKVYGNVGISFKGSGFYKNDARSSGSSKSATAPESTPTSGETSGTGDKKADKAGKADKGTDAKKPAKSTDKPSSSTTKS